MTHILLHVPLHCIQDNPFQVRSEYPDAAITALAHSIANDGLLQIPTARIIDHTGQPCTLDQVQQCYAFTADDWTTTPYTVQLAFGHCRKRALDWLMVHSNGSPTMPLHIASLTDEQMFTAVIAENMQRSDVDAIAESHAIRNAKQRFGWSDETLAARLGYERTSITKKIRLVDLPQPVQDRLRTKQITLTHAYEMIPALNLPDHFLAFLRRQRIDLYTAMLDLQPTEIHHYLQHLVSCYAVPLTIPAQQHFTDPTLQSARCSDCALRFKANKQWWCADKACHQLKVRIMHRDALRLVAEQVHVEVVNDDEDLHDIDPSLPVNRELMMRCPFARLTDQRGHVRLQEYSIQCSAKQCECQRVAWQEHQNTLANEAMRLNSYIQDEVEPLIDELMNWLQAGDTALWSFITRYAVAHHNDHSVQTMYQAWRILLMQALVNASQCERWTSDVRITRQFVAFIKTTFHVGIPTVALVVAKLQALDADTIRWTNRAGYRSVRPSHDDVVRQSMNLATLISDSQHIQHQASSKDSQHMSTLIQTLHDRFQLVADTFGYAITLQLSEPQQLPVSE